MKLDVSNISLASCSFHRKWFATVLIGSHVRGIGYYFRYIILDILYSVIEAVKVLAEYLILSKKVQQVLLFFAWKHYMIHLKGK